MLNRIEEIIVPKILGQIRWFYAGLILAVSLGFSWYLTDSFDLPKITAFYIGVFVLMGTWLICSVKLESRTTPLDWPVLAFLAVYGLALVFSWDVRVSFWGQYRSYVFGWLALFLGAVFYWLTVQFYSEKLEKTMIETALFSGFLASLYGIFQYFGIEFKQMPAHLHDRVWSSFGNPIYFGGFLTMLLPLSIEKLLSLPNEAAPVCSDTSLSPFQGEHKGVLKSLKIVSVQIYRWTLPVLLLTGLVLSLSRSAWLGAIGALLLYSVLRYFPLCKRGIEGDFVPGIGHIFSKPKAVFFTFVFITVIAILFFAPARKRFASMFSPEQLDYARWEGWKQSLKIVKENPFLGTGPDTFVYSFRKHRSQAYLRATGSSVTNAHAHNDLLQYAATSGLLGLGVYLWMWAVIFRLAFSKISGGSSSNRAALFASLCGLFIQNQFNFWTPATMMLFWLFLALVSAPWSKPSPIKLFERTSALGFLGIVIGIYWVVRPVISDYHFMKAEQHLLQKNYQSAAAEIENAIRKNRAVSTYYNRLTNIFRDVAAMDATGKASPFALNNAVVVTRQAMLMIPKNPDCYNNYGVALMWVSQMLELDKKAEAKEAFEKAIEMDPNFIDAWSNLAKVAHLRGELDQETGLWKKILQIDPNYQEAKLFLQMLEQQKDRTRRNPGGKEPN